jgi:hydrogenase expression/formation protein HypE
VAEFLVEQMKRHPLGSGSVMIGDVLDERSSKVFLRTMIGGTRILDMLSGEQLPRIC